MRTALSLTVVLLLGSTLLAWGLSRPAAAQEATAGASVPQEPIEALADGLDAALTKAADRLKTRRTEAAPAIDAALRASEVASQGGPALFDEVHELVRRARSSAQAGDETAAREAIVAATDKLRASPEASSGEPPRGLKRYVGATLIDRFGVRIGEVVDAAERDGRPMLLLALGKRDAAGAMAPGARLRWVDVDQLVFGKVKTLGATLVAWPRAPAA